MNNFKNKHINISIQLPIKISISIPECHSVYCYCGQVNTTSGIILYHDLYYIVCKQLQSSRSPTLVNGVIKNI